jgi:suppressor of ftsI
MMTNAPIQNAPGAAPPRRRRRPLVRALTVLLVLGLLGVLGLAGVVGLVWSRADTSNLGKLDFANQLKIPPLLQPHVDAAGTKVFDLRLQAGSSQLLPGKAAETWGINGAYLGPTLRASLGDKVRINVTNTLPEATTLHWHRMHLPAKADGGPHQLIAPGATWSPTWTIDQRPRPCGTTRIRTARPKTTSRVACRACSCSTTRSPARSRSRSATASTTSP